MVSKLRITVEDNSLFHQTLMLPTLLQPWQFFLGESVGHIAVQTSGFSHGRHFPWTSPPVDWAADAAPEHSRAHPSSFSTCGRTFFRWVTQQRFAKPTILFQQVHWAPTAQAALCITHQGTEEGRRLSPPLDSCEGAGREMETNSRRANHHREAAKGCASPKEEDVTCLREIRSS